MDALFHYAAPADAERLSGLMRATFIAAYGHRNSAENLAAFLAKNYSADIQRAEIEDAQMRTLIARAGDTWAGFAQLRFDAPAPAEVELERPVEVVRFYFAPDHHGSGAAAALMQRARQDAREHGSDGLWLNVWQQAPQAIRFYTKQGFRIVGRSVFRVGADAQDDWVMRCAFDPA